MDFYRVNANSIFRILNPVGTKLLTRLRVGLSHLREHKYNHNFYDTDNPYCSCDGISNESVDHYLLCCPNYARSRIVLFVNLNSINSSVHLTRTSVTTEILLYGKDSFDDHINKKIIESTITFLIDSSRFREPLFTSLI